MNRQTLLSFGEMRVRSMNISCMHVPLADTLARKRPLDVCHQRLSSPHVFLISRTHCNYCSINLRINYSFLFPEIRGILHMRKRGFYFPLADVYCAACYCICHLISNLNIGKSPAAMRHDLRFWPVTIMSAYKTIDIAVDSAY